MDDHHSQKTPHEQLQRKRAKIEAEMLDFRGGGGDEPTYDPNFADTSQVTAEPGEAGALVHELSEALDQIDAALQRIEDGTYGSCESCGNEVGADRLAAMPAAARCIDCASGQ